MKKLVLVLLLIPLVSFGQDYGNSADAMKLCTVLQTNNFGIDAEAEKGLDRILSVIGASKRFVLKPCDKIDNAIAASYKGIRYILYDRDFMSSLNSGNNWKNLFILAHEVGHHINGHSLDLVLYAAEVVEPESLANQRKQELEADEFAGFVLAKLGGPISAANQTISSISTNSDDSYSTHPSRDKRLKAVSKGYYKKTQSSQANNSNFDIIYYNTGRWEGPVKKTISEEYLEDPKTNTIVLGTTTTTTPYGKGIFIFNNGEVYEGYFNNNLLKDKNQDEEYYYEAKKQLETKNISEAKRLFNLSFYTTNNDYLKFHCKYELGDIEFFEWFRTNNDKNLSKAISFFEEALSFNTDLNKTHPSIYYLLAQSHFKLDGNSFKANKEKTIEYGKKWMDISDRPFDDIPFMYRLYRQLFFDNEYRDAIKYTSIIFNEGMGKNIMSKDFKFNTENHSVYESAFFDALKIRAISKARTDDIDGAKTDFELIETGYNDPRLKEDAKIKENFIHFYRAQFYRKNAKLVIDYIRLNYSLQHLIENSSQYNDRKYSTYLIYKAYGLYIIDKYSSETINIQEMCDLVNKAKVIASENNISLPTWEHFSSYISKNCN